MTKKSARIGFIGMGHMGAPMVERMIAAGYAVQVHARREETADAARALGAEIAQTPDAAAHTADIMMICAYTSQQVRDLCLGPDGVIAAMRPGSVLLIHTTCPPQTMTELVEATRGTGISVVDAPLDTRPSAVAAGAGRALVSGSEAALAIVLPVISTYTGTIIEVGEVGVAQSTKILNVLLTAAQTQLIAEAARTAEQLGLDPATALRALNRTGVHSTHLDSALDFDDDPAAHAAMVKPFVTKDILNYGDSLDSLDLGLLGLVTDAIVSDVRRAH